MEMIKLQPEKGIECVRQRLLCPTDATQIKDTLGTIVRMKSLVRPLWRVITYKHNLTHPITPSEFYRPVSHFL